MLDRLSLRARLMLGVVALAAVGLVAADVATYSSLRSFLLDRTDTPLDRRPTPCGGPGPGGGHRAAAPPGNVRAGARRSTGTTVVATFSGDELVRRERCAAPDLPATVAPPAGAATATSACATSP